MCVTDDFARDMAEIRSPDDPKYEDACKHYAVASFIKKNPHGTILLLGR